MINAVHYELVRLRTLRSTWILFGAALAMQFVIGLKTASGDNTPREAFVSSFSGIQLTLVTLCGTAIAVLAFGHEYGHRTITTTVLTLRSRSKILGAKALTVGGFAALTGVGMVAMTLLAEVIRGIGAPAETWRVFQVLFAVVGYSVLSALVGLAVAMLTRNGTIAMVTMIGVPAVVEPMLWLGRVVSESALPFMAAARTVTPQVAGASAFPLIGLTIVLLGAGGVLLARRDV